MKAQRVMLRIFKAKMKEDIEIARGLFVEYVDSLEFDLNFQNFEEELANLPGEYAEPAGCLLLAEYQGKAAGCVALRKINNNICEGKRLYVKPEFRGLKIGRKLVEALIAEARKMGYKFMRGDTVASMKAANHLYTSLGFYEIEPYRYNPLEDAIFLELKLE